MKETAFLIQPDGMPVLDAIHDYIERSGLKIEHSKVLRLSRRQFLRIYPRKRYPEFSEKYWREWIKRTLSGKVEVGIITGNDAIRRFASLAGRRADPLRCRRGTIRRDFGVHCARKIDGMCMHNKVVHRPLTKKEAAHNVRLVKELLGI